MTRWPTSQNTSVSPLLLVVSKYGMPKAPFSTAMSEFLAITSLPSLPVIAITVTNQQRHSSCPAASGRRRRTERAHKARMVVNVRYGKPPGAASAKAEGPQKMGDPTSDADWATLLHAFMIPPKNTVMW
ncbi:unnamed protein product [Diplocarpon coronariae]|uniref:RNA polymerase III, largest subunit n=1 Tax=Diplocarpon coronariae TaxID=2795749 RepID=A0A218Z2W4_9HELO|nr:RNA polymerase III, largest subunit [Marssonina coronariae]